MRVKAPLYALFGGLMHTSSPGRRKPSRGKATSHGHAATLHSSIGKGKTCQGAAAPCSEAEAAFTSAAHRARGGAALCVQGHGCTHELRVLQLALPAYALLIQAGHAGRGDTALLNHRLQPAN